MDRVEKYRRLPDGFPTLLNKMLRAVLVSRPLEAVRFFADYLEAEVNRRTLCDLQLRQPCPSGAVQPTDPWVQYMSFVTIQRAIDDLLREEQPTNKSSFQWDQDQRHLKLDRRKCQGSSGRRRITHKPLRWPPVVKAMPRCRRRFDRYGPIVKTISITSRSIKRYMTDETTAAAVAADQCQRRRPIANYWRQILRDCSVKSGQWNRKTEESSRRRRRSSSLAEVTTSGRDDGKEAEAEGSGSSIDPYLEPKRRRKARNDEGLAKIIYRELGSQPLCVPVEGERPSEMEDKLPPGKASKAVQVELVPSILPRKYPPCPTPARPTSIEEIIPIQRLDKAVQVDLDDTSTEDITSAYPASDSVAPPLDTDVQVTCPPERMTQPLTIDWTLFLGPTQPWPHSEINWMTMKDEDDEQDVPAIQAQPSPAAEALPEEVVDLVDLDFPAATTVADAPAMPLLLGEKDDPASSALADVPAEPLDLENDAPASSALADIPAEPLMPGKESAAQLMDEDEVDDPFSDEGVPPATPVTSEGQGP